jgi:hypothetical protein
VQRTDGTAEEIQWLVVHFTLSKMYSISSLLVVIFVF